MAIANCASSVCGRCPNCQAVWPTGQTRPKGADANEEADARKKIRELTNRRNKLQEESRVTQAKKVDAEIKKLRKRLNLDD